MKPPVKICVLSDTHNQHKLFPITPCDIAIHCGDFSSMGYLHECKAFLEWFSVQPAKHRIFISGNHDSVVPFEQPILFREIVKEYPGVTYLENEGITVEGLKFWGRAMTPTFNDWAFMADPGSPKMVSSLDIIPTDTDVLITHGPPYQILDNTEDNQQVGCKDMRYWLENGVRKPRLIVCGHIHHGRGVHLYGDKTTIVNAAVLNDWYRFQGNLMKIDITDESVKVIKE